MTTTEVQRKLQEIHRELSYKDWDLEMNESFRSQGYDSLDQVEFFIVAEKKFNIHLSDERLMDVATPSQLVEMIVFQTHLTQAPDPTI